MSDTVTIGVGEAPPPPHEDDDDGGDSGDEGDAGDGLGDGGGDDGDDEGDDGEPEDGTALPPGFGLDGAGEGCSCNAAADARGLALFVVLGLRRRRSTTRSCRD
jgi:hypothetical protein